MEDCVHRNEKKSPVWREEKEWQFMKPQHRRIIEKKIYKKEESSGEIKK